MASHAVAPVRRDDPERDPAASAVLGVFVLQRHRGARIALSVLVAALNNLWPVVTRRLWLAAFGFGQTGRHT